MKIWYGLSREALLQFRQTIERLAAAPGVRRVCEIGGGANPFLLPDFVQKYNLEYTVVDISADELAKAPANYRKVQADIAAPSLEIGGGYDLVFSQWCAEHVSSGRAMHENVWRMLAPGGRDVHIFPTLFSPPFVVNRLMPERLSAWILSWLQPFRAPEGNHAKFPAYYHWCRGPMRSQLRRLTELGYGVEEYAGFFGHSGSVAYDTGYLNRLPPLCKLHELLSRQLVQHPVAALTSIAYMVLVRPTATLRESSAVAVGEPANAAAL